MVIGLGNPGKEYEKTRHNIGFMALDFIAKKNSAEFDCKKFKSLITSIRCENKKILLVKPQTYMNLSGEAVAEVSKFFKVTPEKIILIFDDVSLACGKIRIRKKGSHGGHNGVRNIIDLCGTDKFPRIKIGVGGKPNEHWELADWVLSKFSLEDMSVLEKSMEKIYESLRCIITENIDSAMNKFN